MSSRNMNNIQITSPISTTVPAIPVHQSRLLLRLTLPREWVDGCEVAGCSLLLLLLQSTIREQCMPKECADQKHNEGAVG